MSNPPTTLVCFAVKEEAIAFKRFAATRPNIEVLLTGMGRQNAEKAVGAALARRRPERVITAGFAGGLRPELAHGTVVYFADEATGLLDALRATGALFGRFHCADAVISTAAQKRALYDSTGADAVEMESFFIWRLCQQYNLPTATVRVILDTAAEDLALDFNQVMTADLRLDPARLALYLLKSPRKIQALLRLRKQSATAAAQLAGVLARTLQF